MLIALITLGATSLVLFVLMLIFLWKSSNLAQEKTRLQKENESFKLENAELRGHLSVKEKELEWLETARRELENAFKSLAGDVLKDTREQLVSTARESLDSLLKQHRQGLQTHKAEMSGLLDPVKTNLEKLEKNVREIEEKRENAYGSLNKQLDTLQKANQELSTAVTTLRSSLKSSTTRGRWGEYELKRIVELAGMTEHVHFDLQAASEEGRPDLTVGLPGGGVVPIDSKVPLSAYIDATEATNERETAEFIQKHARAFRDTVKRLGSKAYWSQFSEAAEFVVMFVPIESAVSEAFKADRELLDFALRYKVLVATPVTLLALLKSVAYGWQQHQVADNARAIAEAGKDLYNRLSTFVEHMSKVGKSIDTVVKRYNDAVGSLQGRLIPGARKFEELAGKADSLEEPGQITTAPRRLAEELPDDNAESTED